MDGQTFLKALATVLSVAAVITVLFQRLRLPVVLGYVLAGILVSPYIPIPLVADRAVITTLSELGVILLMFSLGLEFSLRKLVRVGPTAGIVMAIEVSFMLWLGYFVGRLFGWRPLEAVFTGAIVSISSTMIIAKTFSEQRPDRAHVELVFGVLVFEDLMAILLLAALTALSAGGLSAAALASTAGRLGAFLLLLIVVGLLVIPRLVRAVARFGSAETLLVMCVGLCFAVALLAHALGYSVALGAFLCGSLVAESGEGKRIEAQIQPLRDLFGAVFFVSVGMSIDPRILVHYWREGAVLTAVVIGGKITAVTLAAFLTGHSLRASLQAAMTLAQIGEFSFILAGLGASQGATREFLYPTAVGVSVITALLTPWLMRASLPVAAFVDRRLPRPLQNFVALYAAWLERLRTQHISRRSQVRRLAALVLLDDLCLAGLYIGAALSQSRLQPLVERWGGLTPLLSRVAIAVFALLLSVPFWIGMIRTAGRLALELSVRVFPLPPESQADLGAAPRRVLRTSLHILVLLVAGTPLLAVTQPFLPSLPGALEAILWTGLVGLLGVAFLRSTTNLLGHVQAGAQAVVEVLAAQSQAQDEHSAPGTKASEQPSAVPFPLPESLLSGLGSWATHRVEPGDHGVQKSLAQLNLRGLSGATVLAIHRDTGSVTAPGASDTLRAGDVLILAGSAQAIDAAHRLLRGDASPGPGPGGTDTESGSDGFFATIRNS